jgi:hypothetical protein
MNKSARRSTTISASKNVRGSKSVRTSNRARTSDRAIITNIDEETMNSQCIHSNV